MKKRFFALALALLMLFGTAPVSTSAEDSSWVEQECPVAAGEFHDLAWTTIQIGNCTNEEIYEIRCTKCKKSQTYHNPALGHEWDEGVVTKAATCTEVGEMTYTCQRMIINASCGQTKTETIPALGHSWDGGTVTKTATCAGAGEKTYTCTRCGETKTESIPALDHVPGEWVVDLPATCTEQGIENHICSSCHEAYEDRQYGPLGHAPEMVAGKAATCTEAGLREGTICSRCGTVLTEQAEIPALGHDWGGWTVVTEPQPGVKGQEKRVCTRCGAEEYRDLDALPVTPVPVTEVPITEVPVTEVPITPVPITEVPVTEVPITPVPITEVPVTEVPITPVPITEVPVTEVPITPVPITEVPVTEVPITPVPITEVPVTEVPITPEPDPISVIAALRFAVKEWDDDNNAAGARPDSVVVNVYIDGVLHSPITLSEENGWCWGLLGIDPDHAPDITFEEVVPEGYVCTQSMAGNTVTFVNHYMPEGRHPALTLIKDKQIPEGDVEADEQLDMNFSVINSGNTDLSIRYHVEFGNGDTISPGYKVFIASGEHFSSYLLRSADSKYLTPGTETAEYLGRVDVTLWLTGLDPDTEEQLCESNKISGSWNVKRPGPAGWEIPDETQDSDLKITQYENGASADPSGYQLGEEVHVEALWENTSSVPIDVQEYYPFDGDSYVHSFSSGEKGYSGVTRVLPDWHLYAVTETDVDNGYIYFPPLEGTWTDPGSGKEKKAVSNSLTLPVISKTGLLLHKSVANIPANGSWFEEGETIRWSLTVTNNSQEPIRNIIVTDQGVTVGSFAELAPGETQPCTVPDHVVTGYDAIFGSVMNQASATGEDVRGISHTWDSNPAHAPTNKEGSVKYPVPDPDGKKTPDPDPDKKPDGHTDPLGPVITGSVVSATVVKAETSFPANGSWYQEGETISYLITVTNDGEVPLTNISVTDSLGGFLPIGTAPSLAPGKSASFPFSWTVTAPDVNVGWVINSATATYEITGIPGTPILSSPVYSQTSEHPGPIPGITPGGTPELPGGTFDPDKLPKDPDGGTSLVPVLDPDGKPVLDPDGKPVIAPPGTTPVLDPEGKIVTDPSGYPVLKLPDGTYVVIGPDGKPIITDEYGNPILKADGTPTYLNFGSGPAFCETRLLSLGATDGVYNLHACSAHMQAAQDAEAAAAAGTADGWRAAAEIWRAAIDEMYQTLYDAADSGAKVAVLNDQVTYYSYLGTWKAMRAGGDETATEKLIAESLRLRAIELCNILHTAPAKLADSLTGTYQSLSASAAYDRSVREIGALQGADSPMTEHYDAAYGRALAGIRTRISQTGGSARTGAFLQAQRDWQLTLDAIVNANYKAADQEGKKAIAACRMLLDKVYEARKGLMDLLYADAPEVAAEIVSNLYRNAILEAR